MVDIGSAISTGETILLTVLGDLAPLVTSSSEIGAIITGLETYLPLITAEASDLITPIKNIIAALQGNSAVTTDQLTALQALDAQADAAFDAALAAYNAANPAT